jgi:DNA-binding MarR family transcriptional regulator
MPATSVSATVRRLARRGDVEQIPNPSDGRSRLIILTPAGVAAHSETASVFFAETRPLAAALGAAEPAQRALLQRLDRALREVSGLDPRPYVVDDLPDEQRQRLDYDGEALLPDEEGTVLAYIDFIRTQRKERGTP